MPTNPLEEDDLYEPADLGEPPPVDETERRRLREEAEARETRREILLGKIAKARSLLYAAEEQGETAQVAALQQTLAALTRERKEV